HRKSGHGAKPQPRRARCEGRAGGANRPRAPSPLRCENPRSVRRVGPAERRLQSARAATSFSDDAAALADAMVEVESQQPHWAESARGLLAALIMWEATKARSERRAPSLFNV